MTITNTRLRELLHYNEASGVFIWKRRPETKPTDKTWNKRYAGKVAGNRNVSHGYVVIDIDGKPRFAHRMAFLYMTGDVPAYVDHVNGMRHDNRWSNIRPCNAVQNAANKTVRNDSSTGLKGVHLHKKRLHHVKPFQARLKRRSLGYFATAEEAHAAYFAAHKAASGDFARAS